MKLLFLFHEYGDRRWYQYVHALERLGHRVDVCLLANKELPDQAAPGILKAGYDAVWINSAEYLWSGAIAEEFLQAARDRQIPLVGYVTLKATVPLTEWFRQFARLDLCLVHSREVARRARSQGLTAVRHLPYGFDPASYFPCGLSKDIPISFAGNPEIGRPIEEDRRVRIINALRPFKIRVFGAAFEGRLADGIEVAPFATNREMNQIYNRSLINLDIPCVTSPIDEINELPHPKFRLFDVPGSGNFLLGGYAPEFDEAFPEDICAAYYRDLDSLCDRVEYYLSHAGRRRAIEREAFRQAHARHRQEIYLEQAITWIEETRSAMAGVCR